MIMVTQSTAVRGLRDGLMSGQIITLLMLLIPYDVMDDITPTVIMNGWFTEMIIVSSCLHRCRLEKRDSDWTTGWTVTILILRIITHYLTLWPCCTAECIRDWPQWWYVIMAIKVCIVNTFITSTTLVALRYQKKDWHDIIENIGGEMLYLVGYGYIYGTVAHIAPERGDAIMMGMILMMVNHARRK